MSLAICSICARERKPFVSRAFRRRTVWIPFPKQTDGRRPHPARAPPPSSIHRRRRVTPSPRVTLPHLCAIKQHQRHRRARQPLARRSGQCVPAGGHDGVRRRRPRVLVRVSRPRLVPLVSRRVLVRTLAVLDARIARARAITAGTRATARRRWLRVFARRRPGTSERGAGEARSD